LFSCGAAILVVAFSAASKADAARLPSLSVKDTTVAESDSGARAARFSVVRSGATSRPVTVRYSAKLPSRLPKGRGGAATGTDFVTKRGVLRLRRGQRSGAISVPVKGDALDEEDETFALVLSAPRNARLADRQALATIVDNDSPPSLAVRDTTVTEGSASAVFRIQLSAPSGKGVTVDYTAKPGTANTDADFAATSGTARFAAGATTVEVSVPVRADTLDEPDERFFLVLVNAQNAGIRDSTAEAAIGDDDDPPTLSINDAGVSEGNTGTRNLVFTISLSAVSGRSVSVSFVSADGTATEPSDYAAASGMLSFSPGQTSRTVAVSVKGDTSFEPDESLGLVLSAPGNATLADASGGGRIDNDDAAPVVSVADVSQGESGGKLTFVVRKTGATELPASVLVHTEAGSATSIVDYGPVSQTVAFAPSETSKEVEVPLVADPLDETNETLTLGLSDSSQATVGDGTATGTIVDDDQPPVVSVADVTVDPEGDSGSKPASFTVALSAPSGRTVTVTYATVNGTAQAPADYTATGASLTFTPGQTTLSVAAPVKGDTLDEVDETFTLALSNANAATIGDGAGVGTIVDDDGAPSLRISDVSRSEGTGGATVFTFTVTKSGPTALTTTVHYSTSNGTAISPSDYTGASGTLTFGSSETTKTFGVNVAADNLYELDETFLATLDNPTNAGLTDGQATGAIANDDAQPRLVVADIAVPEGNTGTTPGKLTVQLSAASGLQTTVDVATAATGGATGNVDFQQLPTTTLTFAPGATSKDVTVNVIGDRLDESPTEGFLLNLSNPGNAVIGTPSAKGTITDDDDPPSLSIGDVSIGEGNTGTRTLNFAVSLSAPSGRAITVQYATADETATQPADYASASGALSFSAGETTKTIAVTIKGDTTVEPDETFTVNLSAPTNASIADGVARGTITDDDVKPTVSIADASMVEGNSGTAPMTFTVSLSVAIDQPVAVNYTTVPGTASDPADFATTTGTLTFAPGQTTRTVDVQVRGDAIDELNETFSLTLSNPQNGTLGDAVGLGTILDDDTATISIDDVALTEGDVSPLNATFTVSLSTPSSRTVTVSLATANGSAVAGVDYTPLTATVTFASGQTSQTRSVQVLADLLDEADETFFVNLSAPTQATISDPQGIGTIVDNDPAPTVSVSDANVTEGDAGTVNATFTIGLSSATARQVAIDVATSNGTAKAPSDYAAKSQPVSLSPGSLTATFTVAVNGDKLAESNETFSVVLANASNATIADAQGIGTIVDDDPAAVATLSVDDVSITEGSAGTTNARFTVTRSSSTALIATVDFATVEATATDPEDFTAVSGTLTFLEGEETKTVDVAVKADTLDEPDETFDLSLSNATNAEITDGVGTGAIADDDDAALTIDDSSVAEGDSGATNAIFVVRLSGPSTKEIRVAYASSNGTATAPADYASVSGTLIFAPGQSWKKVELAAAGDTAVEPDETLALDLSGAVNATLADAHAVGTIRNDDGPVGTALPAPLGQSTGPVFYVSTLGDDANPGSELQPWRTIQKAVDTLGPGQQAYVRAGVYEENVLYDPNDGRGHEGTAAAPITVRNYPGEQPTLRPAQLEPSYPLRLKGSYFRFQGFIVEGSTLDNTVNVFITDQSSGGGAHHIELSDCEVRGAQRASGIFVHWRDVHHIQLLRNRVHDNNELGVQHQGIYLEANDSVIADNVTYNHTQGFGIQVRNDTALGPNNVVVANNTTAHNELGGIVVEHSASDVKVVNNISAFNGTGILGYFSPGHPEDRIGGGNEAWNNLLFGNRTDMFNSSGPEGTKPVVNFHHNITGLDPLFADAAGANYRLAEASPAIGQAVPAWSPLADADGHARDPDPDLGAFERT
jgi:large repetitive protein